MVFAGVLFSLWSRQLRVRAESNGCGRQPKWSESNGIPFTKCACFGRDLETENQDVSRLVNRKEKPLGEPKYDEHPNQGGIFAIPVLPQWGSESGIPVT